MASVSYMNEATLKLARYFSVILTVALPLGILNHYVFCENETNHIGGSPYVLFVVFVPVALISLRMLRVEGKRWILPLVLAAGGSLNVIVFDTFHIMEGYSAWIHSGMPARPAWSLFQACGK